MRKTLPIHLMLSLAMLQLVAVCADAQDILAANMISHHLQEKEVPVTVKYLKEILNAIEEQDKVTFFYDGELIDNVTITVLPKANASLEQKLTELLTPLNLSFKKLKGKNYVILSSKEKTLGLQKVEEQSYPDNADSENLTEASPTADGIKRYAIVVTGKVVDTDNQPLPGVNVILKGTTIGTATDADGSYRLNVPDEQSGGILVFSFIGFATQEVSIGGRTVIDIGLTPDISSLDEVVVVGYGEVRKSDLTGSVASVKKEQLTAFPTTNAVQALAGRAAGVYVIQNSGQPGANISVRVRGTNSIQGNNEPLYVVDGFPYSGNPTLLNNGDIESIEVLKDASATAIYGSRGANGVVLITTKQGKAGQTKVDYEFNYSLQELRKKLDLLTPREYGDFYNTQAVNDGLAPYFSQPQLDDFTALGEGTDWQDLTMETAPLQQHSLTVSGGNDKTKFSVSAGAFAQDGIVINSDFNRYSLRANVTHQISPKFDLGYNATLSKIVTNRIGTTIGNRGSGYLTSVLAAPATLTPYNDDGTYRALALAYPFISGNLNNPMHFINEEDDVLRSNRVLANMAATFKPIEGLSIKVMGGIENNDDRSDAYRTLKFIGSPGIANVQTAQYTSLLNENIINYTKKFGMHSLAVTAGFTYQDFIRTTLGGGGIGFLTDYNETYDLRAAATPSATTSSYSKSTLLSYLGRVNYSFSDKYLLTASFRADGSSKFSEGNKWGYFPSLALAWKVTNEAFMKNIPAISDLKIRASIGATGSQAIEAYQTLTTLVSTQTVFNNNFFTAFSPGSRLPGKLKWETTVQTNIGIDAYFLNNRLSLTADYYLKDTKDLLNRVQLPASLGYGSVTQNIGEIQNKGIELTIGGTPIEGNFKWDLSGNISFNRNKVVKLSNGQEILGSTFSTGPVNDVINLLREGEPLGVFYGYEEEGYTPTGDILYRDNEPDGAINSRDKRIIGDPNPDFIYGLNSTMSFKGFEFTLFLQGSQGNDLFNLSATQTIDLNFGMNMPRDMVGNTWTPENTNAKYPKIMRNITGRISDRFVEDGSYLRLKTILIAYNLPVAKLGIKWMRNAQIYASGQNLFTLTDYSWYDPEVNSYGSGDSINQGIDHYGLPTAKTLTFGLRAGF
jgi:TonB-dependent starch-binding outer membrane protein SusC